MFTSTANGSNRLYSCTKYASPEAVVFLHISIEEK